MDSAAVANNGPIIHGSGVRKYKHNCADRNAIRIVSTMRKVVLANNFKIILSVNLEFVAF